MKFLCLKVTLSIVFLGSVSLCAFAQETGHYQVPVSDQLKAFADFQMKSVSLWPNKNPKSLRFQLPKELVGTASYYTILKLSESSNHWSGPNASGTCDQSKHSIRCNLSFHDLLIDQTEVEKAINATSNTPLEKMNRLQVAAIFKAEPIGTLDYQTIYNRIP